MGKLVEDAQAVATAADALVAEATTIEAEQGGNVSNGKDVFKITVMYTDGSTVDFSPVSDESASPAPVVSPVTDTSVDSGAGATADTPDTPSTAEDTSPTEPVEVPEGGAEVEPTIAGVVPGQS